MESDPYLKVELIGETKRGVHPFHDCTLHYFGLSPDIDYCWVILEQSLEKNILYLKVVGDPDPSAKYLKLGHAPKCPFKQITLEPNDKIHVRVGVSVIVENMKGEILITKRPAHMRTCNI
jgi:hypothetical protein